MNQRRQLLTVLKNFNPEIKEKASIYVPAIGKVTIMILLRNLLRLVQNQPEVTAEPAAPVELNGTIEQSAPGDKTAV